MDPKRSHFCEQLGGERPPKKRVEMEGGGLEETMQRIIEHTGAGLAPGNVEECVCVCVCVFESPILKFILEISAGRI